MHAIFLLCTLVLDIHSERRGPVFAAFVDLRKAFPSVGRDALFQQMLTLGIPYHLVVAIRSFYITNVARLRVDNTVTRDFFVAIGVLEGSVLSPCLFGILFSIIWDLFEVTDFPTPDIRLYNVNSVWFIAYADDLVVLTLCPKKLESVLNKMASELKKLNLQMSLTKTEVMVFQHARSTMQEVEIRVGSVQLKQVNSFKYLGFIVIPSLSFSAHVARAAERARAAALITAQLIKRLSITKLELIGSYYTCYVESQFYCLELVPCSIMKSLISMRSLFVRSIFDLPMSTSHELAVVLFDVPPMEKVLVRRKSRFFLRL